jgi:GDP-L-fucose synthase
MPPLLFDLEGKRVWVAGHTGMAGSAIVRRLACEQCEIVTADRKALDLTQQTAVERWLAREKPDSVFLAAGHVGGIYANNSYPADFLAGNLAIALNVLRAAHELEVKKLLFLGSSCIFPRDAIQPMTEDMLLTGPLEPTNEWYAVAKIAGIKLCQAYQRQFGRRFISAMPTNLYGPGDNFDLESSHVLAALIRKFHDATTRGDASVVLWGSGSPLREFLHVDDLASACLHLLRNYDAPELVNVGTGSEISIRELAELIKDVSGFGGAIEWDASRPDGTPRKLVDVSKLASMGWTATIPLRDGVEKTYAWYANNTEAG